MSPLIATRLVAADGMVVPVGHAVDAGDVVAGTVVGASVVGASVAGTAAVVVVVGAATVVDAATVVEVAAAVDAVVVPDELPSELQLAHATTATTASAVTRPTFIVPPVKGTPLCPRILAGYATHSRESQQRS
jgi:hypothetical protein